MHVVLAHASLQPLGDEADVPLVRNPVLYEADQPIVADRVEERADIGIENPTDAA